MLFWDLLHFQSESIFLRILLSEASLPNSLGRSAEAIEFLKMVYKQHIYQTFQINALSQLPLLLFGLRFIFQGGSDLLAIFFGYTQGLVGLSGTLAFQRARATSERTTKTGLAFN